MRSAAQEQGPPGDLSRLRQEALVAARELPDLLARWLHRVRREGGSMPVSIRHEGPETVERELSRSGNRIAVAIFAVGLYVAASILMHQGAGPHRVAGVPILAIAGYVLALWLTWRLLCSARGAGAL